MKHLKVALRRHAAHTQKESCWEMNPLENLICLRNLEAHAEFRNSIVREEILGGEIFTILSEIRGPVTPASPGSLQ